MKPVEFFPDFLKLKDSLDDIEKLVERYGLDTEKKMDEKHIIRKQARRILYLKQNRSEVKQ